MTESPGRGRSISIAVERTALRRWVVWLAEAFSLQGFAVSISVVDGGADGTSELTTLLALETLLFRPGRQTGVDRLEQADLGRYAAAPGAIPDLLIDLTAAGGPGDGAICLRPFYNGQAGETALAGALFFDGTPRIAIGRQHGNDDPVVVAAGTASLEAAAGVSGAMEAVFSRVIPLLLKATRAPAHGAPARDFALTRVARTIGRKDIMRHSARAVAGQAARAAYKLCCHPSHWRVGWRFVQPGGDAWSRRDLGGARWNVLPDPVDHFYADPFPWAHAGRDFLLFEDLDYKTGKGVVAAVAFDEAGRPGEPRTVLEEPWHLSYPFLIEWNGEIFMIPESSADRKIVAYRAVEFPWRWERHAVLVDAVEAADATIVRHGGRLWMFAVTREGRGGYSDMLSLWSADDLFGPWTPHPANPVLVDDRTARPGGNMVMRGGQLYRPVQDCRAAYGAALNQMRVTKLDQSGFEQELETTLGPDRYWPGRRIHTLNYNGRLETVDGFVLRPKLKFLADRVDARYKPAGESVAE